MEDLATAGAPASDLCRQAHRWWAEAACRSGLDLSGFDAEAPLERRVAWAHASGLQVGTVYSRFSSKLQHSTDDQVRATVTWAAQHRVYAPPEFLCVDEAVKGRRVRRDGLDRLRRILKSRRADVLLVYKVSRLFRQAFRGFQLVQEEVVEEGLRAVSTSQGIDTDDKRTWKAQLTLHGLLDDLLLDAIADHCREGLVGLFLAGYVTGALTVGYKRVEVPGAPPTNRGWPRTMPAVDEETAALILQHFEWAREGLPLREGLRRWRASGGPSDRRSALGQMSYNAYRRMLGNPRYTGRWAFGRKRNSWSSKKDYTRQVDAPEGEVKALICEELRIVSDELFFAVQGRLAKLGTGPRGPRRAKDPQLWDLVTGVFHCAHCRVRFHVCGANGGAMRCPRPECPSPVMVNRRDAVGAVCNELARLMRGDADLAGRLVAATVRLGAGGDEEEARAVAECERKARVLTGRISDLAELAGEGSEQDRAELKARIKAAQADRAGLQAEISRRRAASCRRPLTPEEVGRAVDDLGDVVRSAAAGELGPEAVYRAADMFRRLVGGEVWVHTEARPGRKRAVVRGRFAPRMLSVVAEASGRPEAGDGLAPAEAEVWLRRPPRLDAVAPEVRRLYEDEGLGFRAIAERLGIGCGNVYASYCRYYEMRSLPVPPRRPRGRRPRPA
jgi:DNA invertase Pin-like site-specific DNA recombinase